MCGRARRGQRDYFAYLIKDGKERRRALGQTWEGCCIRMKRRNYKYIVIR